MKNTTLIAPLAASAVAAVANAAFVVTQDAGVWATQMATIATYTDPGRISNLTGSGLSWTGGDGWESYALTGGPAGSIQPVGTSPNVTAINFTASTTAPYTFFEFDFVGSEAHWGPSGTNGLYGVLFNITFTPAPNLSGVTVVVNGTQNLVVNGASTGTVGIYQNTAGAGRIDKIQFTLSSGQSAEITGFSVAVIPAPGAMALLGVAGLVGSRRRR